MTSEYRGVWVVPHISNVYLVNAKKVLPHILGAYTKADTDSDMAFTSKLRQQVLLSITNILYSNTANVRGSNQYISLQVFTCNT